jgi:hypothetical protein
MHHVGTVTKSSRVANREFHGECSCGTAGDFATKEAAISYLSVHGGTVTGLGPTNTFELVDDSAKPEVFPALPTTHVTGATQKTKSPVASPPAPTPLKK